MPDVENAEGVINNLQQSLDALEDGDFLDMHRDQKKLKATIVARRKKRSEKDLKRVKLPMSSRFVCLIRVDSEPHSKALHASAERLFTHKILTMNNRSLVFVRDKREVPSHFTPLDDIEGVKKVLRDKEKKRALQLVDVNNR